MIVFAASLPSQIPNVSKGLVASVVSLEGAFQQRRRIFCGYQLYQGDKDWAHLSCAARVSFDNDLTWVVMWLPMCRCRDVGWALVSLDFSSQENLSLELSFLEACLGYKFTKGPVEITNSFAYAASCF